MLRPILSVALGLGFLVQGVAVAAAPYALPANPAAAEQAAMDVPCHGAAPVQANAHDCCDAGCADMASCALGHLAAAPVTPLQLNPARQAAVTTATWPLKTAVPPFPLRPPISFHA